MYTHVRKITIFKDLITSEMITFCEQWIIIADTFYVITVVGVQKHYNIQRPVKKYSIVHFELYTIRF